MTQDSQTPKKRRVGDGTPGPGRPKGLPNKTTIAVREALTQTFDRVGGVPAFAAWARKNPTEFYKLYAKLLPLQVTGPNGAPIVPPVITLRRGSD